MNKDRNLFQRAMDAIVDGRMRKAERFVAQYRREYGLDDNKVNRH